MNIEAASEKFGTMHESLEAAAVPGKQNEEVVEAEVLTEGDSSDTEDLDVDTSAHPSANVGKMDEAVEASVIP